MPEHTAVALQTTSDDLDAECAERIRQTFAQVLFAALLKLELVNIERGTATLAVTVRDELRQNLGILHGGATAALIDTAAAFACLTLLERGESTTTVDLSIQYLKAVKAGRAMAVARVRRSGRRMIYLGVDVFDENNELCAAAVTTYLRLMPAATK